MTNEKLELIKKAISTVIEKHYKYVKNYDELFYTCYAEIIFAINGCNQEIREPYAYAYVIAQRVVKDTLKDDLMKMDGKNEEQI